MTRYHSTDPALTGERTAREDPALALRARYATGPANQGGALRGRYAAGPSPQRKRVRFDRFGRIIDRWWDGNGSTAGAARLHYPYDRNSNPTYRDIDSAIYSADDKDHDYTYDGLDRLKTWDRGTLSGSTISGTPNREQDFTLDQLGNWATVLEKTSGMTAYCANIQPIRRIMRPLGRNEVILSLAITPSGHCILSGQ